MIFRNIMTPKEKAEHFHALNKDGKWKPRDLKKFDVKKRNIEGLGERYYAIPESREAYERLQSSRGIGIASWDDMVKKVKGHGLSPFQKQLVQQVNGYAKTHPVYDNEKGYVEVGFRYPAMMEHFKKKFKFVRGYDIAPPSIAVAQHLGYDVHLHDISDVGDPIDLKDVRLLCAHEVFEHTPNPIDALTKVYNAADDGMFIHLSVPLQSGRPKIQFAHLWEFKKGDIEKILKRVGWNVIKVKKVNHSEVAFAKK